MPNSDYAVEPFWRAQHIPKGIGGVRSWTLHIINMGHQIDLSTTSMSIIFPDGKTFPLDLTQFRNTKIFKTAVQLDFQKLPPDLPRHDPKVKTDLLCAIAGSPPVVIRTEIRRKSK